MTSYRVRRTFLVLISLLLLSIPVALDHPDAPVQFPPNQTDQSSDSSTLAGISIKGRAPKTGYSRDQFGNGWGLKDGCDVRNVILRRDMTNVILADDACKVVSADLLDPYTGRRIMFQRGPTTSDDVQIDHVVALSNAWQTGAQQLTYVQRVALANDPLNLLAVDGPTNEKKSDGDAATWLPPNKPFRCEYVRRQVDVKRKYDLWMTPPEYDAVKQTLSACNY
jgi:hypothetical protein